MASPAEAGLNRLLERELVAITGRADLPGRPIQYATTDRFLEFVGIKALNELPASDVLTSRQIDEWLQTNSTCSLRDMGRSREETEVASDAAWRRTQDLLPLESLTQPPGGRVAA